MKNDAHADTPCIFCLQAFAKCAILARAPRASAQKIIKTERKV
jgi:hypothetical protein